MKAIKYLAIALISLLFAACQDTEWDVITPKGDELYGNNSITEDGIITIKQLKEKYPNIFNANDQNAKIEDDIKIKGRITGNDIRGNIHKQFNENGMSGYLAEGQEIILALKGLYIGGNAKQPEIGYPYQGSSIGRMSRSIFHQHFKLTKSPIQPIQPIIFDETMNKDEHCGKLVTLKNVSFANADGVSTFAPGDSSVTILGGCVNRALNQYPESKVVVRTSTYAKFAANKLPYDEVNKQPRVVNITGIATRHLKNSDTWQILIRKESDIEIVN